MNDPSKEVDLNICIESQKEVSSNTKNDTAENSKNEIMNAKERKHVESDTEKDAINTIQKQKNLNPTYQVMVLTRVISDIW